MSFKFPVIVSVLSLLGASSLGACGSDSDSPPGGGGCNNNNVAEGAEQCDGMDLHGQTCQSVLMNMSSTGTLSCSNCMFVTSGCTMPGGTGGSTGTGGRTGTGGI